MGIADVIDILLVAVLLFLVYRFIRGRRSGQLLLGVVIAAVILEVGEIFPLRVLGFLRDQFGAIALLALVILFQPELRALMERLGTTPFSGLRKINTDSAAMKDLNNTVSIVCESAVAMGREKVGALMVFERSTKLTDYIRSGVTLDATPSVQLIRNVFFNKAPLHDGAMIMRNNRLVAAGCFLPLTSRSDVLADLGTRHRAAIGLSEQTDAVVVVVSEETGNISVAVNGTLTRDYNYNTLKQALLELLAPTVSNGHHNKSGKQSDAADGGEEG